MPNTKLTAFPQIQVGKSFNLKILRLQEAYVSEKAILT